MAIRRFLWIGAFAAVLLGTSCTTGGGGVGFAGFLSIDVDGVQSGYIDTCNVGSLDLKLVMEATHRVYVTFAVNGGPGGEGYTLGVPPAGFPIDSGVYVTPTYPPGTCIAMTIRDVDGLGPFIYGGNWQTQVI